MISTAIMKFLALIAAAMILLIPQTVDKLFVTFPSTISDGEERSVTVHYSGQPVEASRPPWEGGFVWSQTPSGKPWVATAIQFEGCDVWWPCKDHPTGEPARGLEFYYTVPAGSERCRKWRFGCMLKTYPDGRRTFHWKTELPTNIYGVALNVAPYVRLQSSMTSINGDEIPLEFWAIEDHEEDARALFENEFAEAVSAMENRFRSLPLGERKNGRCRNAASRHGASDH